MNELFSIRTREKTYRFVIVVSLSVSLIIAVASLYYAHSTIQESKKNIYVLENSQALVQAKSTDITNSYDILAKSAIDKINKLIYQQVPDVNNINKQLREATTMSDKSVSTMIDALKNHDYFQNIISQSFYTLLLTDSIQIDYSQNPQLFVYCGTLKIVRNNMTAMRYIVTTGQIQDTGITTTGNTTGFLIRNFKLLSDTEIK